MRLSVEQSTVLRFEAPQLVVMQGQRLAPADDDSQNVLDWQVTIPGAITGARFRDGAGDVTTTARLEGPLEEVEVTVAGTVETKDTTGVLSGVRERVPPAVYLRTTRATRSQKVLRDLAQEVFAELGTDTPLDRAHALAAAVHDAVRHGSDDGETDNAGTAAEALGRGQGTCRAQSHMLIALAIAQHIPARFVYGYAMTDDPGDGREPLVSDGHGFHCWAELHVGKLGWVGFDAANACCPDDRYIRLCSGFDAEDAQPMRVFSGGAEVDSDTEIAVARAAAGQVQQ